MTTIRQIGSIQAHDGAVAGVDVVGSGTSELLVSVAAGGWSGPATVRFWDRETLSRISVGKAGSGFLVGLAAVGSGTIAVVQERSITTFAALGWDRLAHVESQGLGGYEAASAVPGSDKLFLVRKDEIQVLGADLALQQRWPLPGSGYDCPIAAGSDDTAYFGDGSGTVMRFSDGRVTERMVEHEATLRSLALCEEQGLLVSLDQNGTVVGWDLETSQIRWRNRLFEGWTSREPFAFDNVDNTVYVGDEGNILVLDSATGARIGSIDLRTAEGFRKVSDICVSSHSGELIAALDDGQIARFASSDETAATSVPPIVPERNVQRKLDSSISSDEMIKRTVEFQVFIVMEFLKQKLNGVYELGVDQKVFADIETAHLMMTFAAADGDLHSGEMAYIDVGSAADWFLEAFETDHNSWLRQPSGFLETLVQHAPNAAVQYSELALQLAIATCQADGSLVPAEIDALARYASMLETAIGEPVRAAEGIQPAQPERASHPRHDAHTGLEPIVTDSLEAVLADLDDLVGLATVKAEVRSLSNFLRTQKLRIDQGLPAPTTSRHLVFTGNPGTGKTTVARLVGRAYKALGFLPSGHLVEAARSDLVAGYIGQTALKTAEIFGKARGGILFIDEAYSLNRGQEDYGQEAIDTLVKLMEDHREDTVVIVAGYPELMATFLDSNPGLPSRFKRVIDFPDYTTDELLAIFQDFARDGGYRLEQGFMKTLAELFDASPRRSGFGNGRYARQVFEDALSAHADRLADVANPSMEQLTGLEALDLPTTV